MIQLIATDVLSTSTVQQFPLGTVHFDLYGTKYRYTTTPAATALSAGFLYYFDNTYTIVAGVTTTLAASGKTLNLGAPQVAFLAGAFGWMAVAGTFNLFTTGTVAANAKLFTTATAGKVLDSGGGVLLPGVNSYAGITGGALGSVFAPIDMYASN